jgi:hypothetical protein
MGLVLEERDRVEESAQVPVGGMDEAESQRHGSEVGGRVREVGAAILDRPVYLPLPREPASRV